MLLFLLACSTAEDSQKHAGGCDSAPLEEIEAQPPPGWTQAAGCDIVCQDVDDGGLIYVDCYVTTEMMAICRYEPPCD